MSIREMLDSMPDNTVIEFHDGESSVGFYVSWAEKGTGFGEMFFGVNKITGEADVDTECMGPESVARILARSVGKPLLRGAEPLRPAPSEGMEADHGP